MAFTGARLPGRIDAIGLIEASRITKTVKAPSKTACKPESSFHPRAPR